MGGEKTPAPTTIAGWTISLSGVAVDSGKGTDGGVVVITGCFGLKGHFSGFDGPPPAFSVRPLLSSGGDWGTIGGSAGGRGPTPRP